ncbi:transforming growth factor beta regulator 1-like [Dysidea avara]|uniref:transforming growth factor beta regulator 1-like n=1 Tax=Dysidea avara TaxID=196820 RepID=UPI00332D01F7
MAEKTMTRKRPISLLTTGDCSDNSSEDSDPHSDSDSNSSCSVTDDKRRYCFLKRAARQMVMENYCLAQRLEKMERQIAQVTRERKFLLEKLLKYEKKKDATVTKATGRSKPPVVQVSPRQQLLPKQQPLPRQPARTKPVVTPSRIPRQRSPDSDESLSDHMISPSPVVNLLPRKKPDRSLPKKIQAIPLKEDGSPVYPINLGGLQVVNLGHVIHDRPSYHTERYILPVGYCSRRSYFSIKEPASRCMYTCKILDGGENPTFEVTSEENPSQPIRGSSSSSCHAILLKAINKARGKDATNTGSGPEFFGYSHPVIVNLLQKLPDVSLCTKYKPMKFQEVSRATSTRPSPKSKKTVATASIKSLPSVVATSLPDLSPQDMSTLLLNSLKQLQKGGDLQLVSPTHFKPNYHVPSPSSSGSSSE